MKSRVVITGAGVVSSIGTGAGNVWGALARGDSGIKPISNFDTSRCAARKPLKYPALMFVTTSRIKASVVSIGLLSLSAPQESSRSKRPR